MSSLETVSQTPDEHPGQVRALAWKILYANHRPSLGPETFAKLVDNAGGPSDVKRLPLDCLEPIGPFADMLETLAEDLGDAGMEQVGRAFANRWASMYRTLLDHLQGRPQRMLEVCTEELIPWFFGAELARIETMDASSARLELASSPVPEAFVAGLIEGAVNRVDGTPDVHRDGSTLTLSYTSSQPSRPGAVRLLVEATRSRFLTATIVPVLLGTMLAASQGAVSLVRGGAALAAAGILHVAANLLNDVYDHRRGVDEANLTPTPFSGGSRVIQRGLISWQIVLAMSAILGLVGVTLGTWLAVRAGWPVLGLGLAGVGLGYAYSGEPFRLSHRGLGELAAGTVFGPLVTAGAFAVQTGNLGPSTLAAGVPVGLMMMGLLAVNELPDAPWDARTGKRTLVVRLGEHAGAGIGLALAAVYVSLVGLVVTNVLPLASLVALATAPLAWHVVNGVRQAGTDADELLPYQAATFWWHASTGLLLAAGPLLVVIT